MLHKNACKVAKLFFTTTTIIFCWYMLWLRTHGVVRSRSRSKMLWEIVVNLDIYWLVWVLAVAMNLVFSMNVLRVRKIVKKCRVSVY